MIYWVDFRAKIVKYSEFIIILLFLCCFFEGIPSLFSEKEVEIGEWAEECRKAFGHHFGEKSAF